MRRTFRMMCWLGVLLLGPASVGHALTTTGPLPLATLARTAGVIVTGDVARVRAVKRRDGTIRTYTTVAVRDVLKGRVGHELVVVDDGGRVGAEVQYVSGMAAFEPGERVLLFLGRRRDGTLGLRHLALGKFDVADGQAVRDRRRHFAVAALQALVARDVDPGEAGGVDMPADADDANLAHSERVALAPRDGAPRAVQFDITVQGYRLIGGRWLLPAAGAPIPFWVDAHGYPGMTQDESVGAVGDAMAAWSSVSESTVRMQIAGLAEPAPRCTGRSMIVFDDPFGEVEDSTECVGVVARGGFCGSTVSTTQIAGHDLLDVTEAGVTVRNVVPGCPVWDRTLLAEVLTHELGHTLGFDHSSDDANEPNVFRAAAAMFALVHNDGRGALLTDYDVNVATLLYPTPGAQVPDVPFVGVDAGGDGTLDPAQLSLDVTVAPEPAGARRLVTVQLTGPPVQLRAIASGSLKLKGAPAQVQFAATPAPLVARVPRRRRGGVVIVRLQTRSQRTYVKKVRVRF